MDFETIIKSHKTKSDNNKIEEYQKKQSEKIIKFKEYFIPRSELEAITKLANNIGININDYQINKKRKNYDKYAGITIENQHITKLQINKYKLINITEIEKLTNLTTLNLNNNQITTITPLTTLTTLTNLTTLSLNNNQITDSPKANHNSKIKILNNLIKKVFLISQGIIL